MRSRSEALSVFWSQGPGEQVEIKICALLPAFNEAGKVAAVVRATQAHVDKVILVDDGSRDGTCELAIAAGAVCLRSASNQGKGAALRKGIASISEDGYTHALFMDADGQHRPADIPILVRTARETNADVVLGSRRFDRRRMPTPRYLSNTIGSRIASWLVGREIRNSQCGFRLVRLDKLRGLRLRAKRYEFDMELLIKMSLAGCTFAHAPVSTVYDQGKACSKMRVVRDTFRICLASLLYRFFGL